MTTYIFVGMLLGSTVMSTHEGKEACEGRRVMLSEKGVIGECVQHGPKLTNGSYGTSLSPLICSSVTCPNSIR